MQQPLASWTDEIVWGNFRAALGANTGGCVWFEFVSHFGPLLWISELPPCRGQPLLSFFPLARYQFLTFLLTSSLGISGPKVELLPQKKLKAIPIGIIPIIGINVITAQQAKNSIATHVPSDIPGW